MARLRGIVGFVIVFSLFTTFLAQRTNARGKNIEIKIGSYITPYSAWGRAVSEAVKNVEERTGGRVKIKHLHSGMLGSNQSMLEQVMYGGIEGAGVDTSSLATIVPEMNIVEMPFLFRDRDEAYYLLDEVISPVLEKKMEEKGLVTSAIMEVGFMDFVMAGPVHKPEDLQHMKIGSWESPVHVSFWEALGGNPIPIPATEVFSAYARGMVDSGANSPSALIAWDKLFGSAIDRSDIYITKTAFTYHAGIIVMNKKFIERIPEKVRSIFEEELDRMTQNIRRDIAAAEPGAYEALAEKGYNIVEPKPAEMDVFRERAQKVYDELGDEIGEDFLEGVLHAREEYRKEHETVTAAD